MGTSPHKKISGSLRKLCIYLVLVFALGFAALACLDDPQRASAMPINQPQQMSQTTSDSSLSTDCNLSSPCVGGGSDNNTTGNSPSSQSNASSLRPDTAPCNPNDPNHPFCVYLDYSQLSAHNQVMLHWQTSRSSSSYQYSTTQLSFPSGSRTSLIASAKGGKPLLNQALNVRNNEFDVIEVKGCVNGKNCLVSEPIVINTGYAARAARTVQTQYAVMLHTSSRDNLLSLPLVFERSAPCAKFCMNGDLGSATYYISRSTVNNISGILNKYKAANDFIDLIKMALPELVESLACTACDIAATVLTVVATIIGFYIDQFQKVLKENRNRNSAGVMFDVKWGIFLQWSSIRAVS